MRGDLWFRKKARCFLSPGSCRRCRLKLFSSSSRFLLFLSLESIYHYSHFLFPFLLNSMCVCVCVCVCVFFSHICVCMCMCVCVCVVVCVCIFFQNVVYYVYVCVCVWGGGVLEVSHRNHQTKLLQKFK